MFSNTLRQITLITYTFTACISQHINTKLIQTDEIMDSEMDKADKWINDLVNITGIDTWLLIAFSVKIPQFIPVIPVQSLVNTTMLKHRQKTANT